MIAILMAALALSQACPLEPMTKEGVLSAERDWVEALERGDRVRLECRLAPQFVDTNWQAKVLSRADVLARLGGPRPQPSLTKLEAQLVGKTAIVHGVNSQTSRDGTDQGSVRFTDIFVYRARRWQAVSAQETVIRK